MNDTTQTEPACDAAPSKHWLDTQSPRIAAAIFFLLMLTLHPFMDYFEFDPDEGNNVIKSLLVAKGYAMYSEIWSDQAPLFTWLLRGWLGIFGWDVDTARVFVLMCSAITLGGVYRIMQLVWGHPHAIAASLLLVLSPAYIIVSVSVMIGLPALMFAVLSMGCMISWAKEGKRCCLIGSAVFLVLAAMTKMFVAFLFPIYGIAVLVIAWQRSRGSEENIVKKLMPALVWGGTVAVTGIVLMLVMVGPSGFDMLVSPHMDAKDVYSKNVRSSIDYRLGFTEEANKDRIVGSWDVLCLAGVGFIALLLRKKWLFMLPAAWFVSAYLVLRNHAPVWYHHIPLLMIPGCMLAGAAVGEIIALIVSIRTSSKEKPLTQNMPVLAGRSLVALVSIVLVIAFLTQFNSKVKHSNQIGGMVARGPRDAFLTEMLRQLAGNTEICFADRQMYAFQAGLPVPPELSVTSHKRFRSKSLSAEGVVEALQNANPGVICLDGWRMTMTQPLWDFLREKYRPIYRDEVESRGKRNGVYVRNDIEVDPKDIIQAAYKATEYPGGGEMLALAHLPDHPEKAIGLLRSINNDHPERSRTSKLFAETLLADKQAEKGFKVYSGMFKKMQDNKQFPGDPVLAYAWRLATWPEEKYQNAKLAEGIAKNYASSKKYGTRAALIEAAARALQGNFQSAQSIASQVARQSLSSSQQRLAQKMADAYKQNKLYLEAGRFPR